MLNISEYTAFNADTEHIMLWSRDNKDEVTVDGKALLHFYFETPKMSRNFQKLLRLGWDINVKSGDGMTLLDRVFPNSPISTLKFLPLILFGYDFRVRDVKGNTPDKTLGLKILDQIEHVYESVFEEDNHSYIMDFLAYDSCLYEFRDGVLCFKQTPDCDFIDLLKTISDLCDFDYLCANSGTAEYRYDSEGLQCRPARYIELYSDIALRSPSFEDEDNVRIIKELLPRFGYHFVSCMCECVRINKGESPANIMYRELFDIVDGTLIVISNIECVGRIDGTRVSYYKDDNDIYDLQVICAVKDRAGFEDKIKELNYVIKYSNGNRYCLNKEV